MSNAATTGAFGLLSEKQVITASPGTSGNGAAAYAPVVRTSRVKTSAMRFMLDSFPSRLLVEAHPDGRRQGGFVEGLVVFVDDHRGGAVGEDLHRLEKL